MLDATCSDLYGPELMVCSRQSLTILDSANGEEIGRQDFAASKHDGDMRAMVEEKIGGLTCMQSASGVRYIVAEIFNGGNCKQCKWDAVYDWQSLRRQMPDDSSSSSKPLPFWIAHRNTSMQWIC